MMSKGKKAYLSMSQSLKYNMMSVLPYSVVVCLLLFPVFSHADERLEDYSERVPGTELRIPMVAVKAGRVKVRSYVPRERDITDEFRREVSVSNFWIGKFELRYEESRAWSSDMLDGKDAFAVRQRKLNSPYGAQHFALDNRANVPATGMNQWSAKRYCHWLSVRTGRFYRLPTEAEWEYACRAGGPPDAYFPWGNDAKLLDEFAVVAPDLEDAKCAAVGTKEPNAWGIYDLLGNVEEWVADGFHEERIAMTSKVDPIIWPASSRLSGPAEEIRNAFRKQGQSYVDNYGVAKGGSGLATRPRHWLAFTVIARTNPTLYDDDPVIAYQDEPRAMSFGVGPAIGFRLARPHKVPDRTTQLWHWGIYFDHAVWLDTTIDPD